MSGVPSEAIQAFFQKYIFHRTELVLTMKSSAASINVDGAFQFVKYDWDEPEWVIGPEWAEPRGKETNVHMHIPWNDIKDDLFVRIWHQGASRHIPHDARICFFHHPPPQDDRGNELFWFYAFANKEPAHPLCKLLPPRAKQFSEAKRVSTVP